MKAILIIDMPYSCDDCDMFYVDKYYHCYRCKAKYDQSLGDESVRQKWCPLKPLPEKKHNNGGYRVIDGTEWFYDSEHDDGWNECIDEILGENEE